MGVVYKAEDTKVERWVALKFLPEELSKDRHAVERFQREARASWVRNHPRICPIYDTDESDGQHFIAMEFLEQAKAEYAKLKSQPRPTHAPKTCCAASACRRSPSRC